MRYSLEEIAGYLSCPDDKSPLGSRTGALACSQCGRVYPVSDGGIVELLPRKPSTPAENREYALEYDREFHRAFETANESMAWGNRETAKAAWIRKRNHQRRAVLSLLRRSEQPLDELVLCDVSAGTGDYTLTYAPHFKWVFHCDLSVDSLQYGFRKCHQKGLTNVFFLRIDYFAVPFYHSLDRILCLDTLIRGSDHEKALLSQIRSALGRAGKAIVDFHHWWHNPLRRVGLLPQNLGQNRSYSRRQTEMLLRESGIRSWLLTRFYQEVDPAGRFHKGLTFMLPATRLMYEFSGQGGVEDTIPHERVVE